MKISENPHYRTYFWEYGQLKKFYGQTTKYQYWTEQDSMNAIFKWMNGHLGRRKYQFILVYWEENYKDKVLKIVEEKDFKFDI